MFNPIIRFLGSDSQGPDVYAAGDQMAQLAGDGFSARVTNHADASPAGAILPRTR